MRSSFRKYNLLKQMTRSTESKSLVVGSQRQDLTKKWIQRIQAKVKDAASTESFSKISSLIDYYNKPASAFKEEINWDYWKENIRTDGVVGKLKDKYEHYKSTQNYNIDSIAQKSVINSEKYETHELLLEWNYNLWMNNYIENISTLIDADHLGDISYVSTHELHSYYPGGRELCQGWRETGNLIRIPHYYENSLSTIIRRQFRWSNRAWQPYWHPVSAWERGIQIKHILMSL